MPCSRNIECHFYLEMTSTQLKRPVPPDQTDKIHMSYEIENTKKNMGS